MTRRLMATACTVALVVACGARTGALLPDKAPQGAAAPSGSRGPAPGDAAAHSDAPLPRDAGTEATEAGSGDAASGAPTCADVGKVGGTSSCCGGKYCGGACVGDPPYSYCMCGAIKGGCPWPLCCNGGCVGAQMCKVPPPKPDYTVVDGGHDCQAGAPMSYYETRTCCNGTACKGSCLLYKGASAPVCVCAGVDGGCPGSFVCCLGGCAPAANCKDDYR